MAQAVVTQEAIDGFLEKLNSEHKSRHAIETCRKNLTDLKQMTESQNNELTCELLKEWRNRQLERGLSKGTVTNKVVCINRFLRYLDCEELCFVNGGRRNLTGQRFGNLIVLEPTDRKSPDRSIFWKCRCCLCGQEKEIPANQLMKGVQVSCGCGKAKRLKETNGYIDGTCLKMVFSSRLNRNNTSGCKGVFLKNGKWAARIQYKKKIYFLGTYESYEKAVAVRKLAEQWVKEDAEKLLEEFNQLKQNSNMTTSH